MGAGNDLGLEGRAGGELDPNVCVVEDAAGESLLLRRRRDENGSRHHGPEGHAEHGHPAAIASTDNASDIETLGGVRLATRRLGRVPEVSRGHGNMNIPTAKPMKLRLFRRDMKYVGMAYVFVFGS